MLSLSIVDTYRRSKDKCAERKYGVPAVSTAVPTDRLEDSKRPENDTEDHVRLVWS